jgi:hypothetical protein
MSEKPKQPPPDPGDLSDDTKKELVGIEFMTALETLKGDRNRLIDLEMKRHGINPAVEDHETVVQKTRLKFSYLAAESEALLVYVDDRTGTAEHQEMMMFQDLDLLGEEIVDIRLDFNGEPGFVVEQIVKNEGEQKDQIRWTGYHLKNGKLHVISLNIPIEELGNTDIDHQKYIQKRLEGLKDETALGLNDTECPVGLAKNVTNLASELRSVLGGVYASVELHSDDIADWQN